MTKKILITGHTGFLGSHLMKRFKEDEYEVIGASRYCEDDGENSTFIDIEDASHVDWVINTFQPNWVIHCAGLKNIHDGEKNPREYTNVNLMGAINVAQACQNYKVQKGLFISSFAAMRPISVYGYTKCLAEKNWSSFNNTQSSFISIRLGNVLGGKDSFIIKWYNKIKNGEPIQVTDTMCQRSFLSLEDSFLQIKNLLEKKKYTRSAYNAIGIGSTLHNIILFLEKITGKKAIVEKVPLPKYEKRKGKTINDWYNNPLLEQKIREIL